MAEIATGSFSFQILGSHTQLERNTSQIPLVPSLSLVHLQEQIENS